MVVGLSGTGELLLGGVLDLTLLLLALLSWEKNKFRLVFIQFGDVGGEAISGLVVSSVIDGDANSLGELGGKTGLPQFTKRETSSELYFSTILSSHGMNKRSELANWSWEKSGSLISSGLLSE